MASPNVVEIQIKGTDQSSPAFQSAFSNTKKLGQETKQLGNIVTATGSVMSAFGNDTVAKTAQNVTVLTFAAKESMAALSLMQTSMKRTVVGIIAVAAAFGTAKLIEFFQQASELQKTINEDTETYLGEIDAVAIRMQELGNMEVAQIQAVNRANEERIKRVQSLATEEENVYAFVTLSHQLKEKEMTVLLKQQEEARTKKKQEEFKKQISLHVSYADATATIFGNLATTAAAFGKKGFAAFRAFRMAEAIASTYSGAARALADYPWPYSIAVAASVVAAGLASVATIAASKPQGQAHAGMDYIPAEGSYNLQRGEMVLDPGTSESVRRLANGSGAAGGDLYIDGQKFGRWLRRAKANGILEFA